MYVRNTTTKNFVSGPPGREPDTKIIEGIDMSSAALAHGRSFVGAPAPRLRLTTRGRGVLATLAATPLVIAALLFALNGGGALASLSGSDAAFQYVTVDAGQTMWGLAEEIAPGADPRDVITDILRLNQLESSDVYAGQQLAVPAQYSGSATSRH
jgi:hypothetical protein